MIATARPTVRRKAPHVAHGVGGDMRAADTLRYEAAMVLDSALEKVSGKRIHAARVPGAGRTFLSRACNGDSSNPLFRLASIFVLLRRLGVPKSVPQRLLDWLQHQLDRAYDDAPERPLTEVLDDDAALDPQDDHPRLRAALGCPDAARQLLDLKRRQLALGPSVIHALEVRLAEVG